MPPQTGKAEGGARPIVACQQLTKVFKDFWLRDRARAVDALDLVVNQHEVFGLLGPNGSGKSTTIKLILGLLRPTRGRVVVFGKAPTDVAIKRRIGYLPEESYLYAFLNARETLDYYAKLFELDVRTRRRRIDELLDMVGLTHAQHRPVREYSKGMQRRIGLAQALINDPDLLILDEPTTGLDPIGTRQVKDLILELGRRGKTVLLSSHLLADVEDVVDRMVILYGGRIRGEGTCDELLTSASRTAIETEELDEETIAEIDGVIRRRSGGQKSIVRVSQPRQKLEELFLGIVERARAERLETSGARETGATAAFLRGDDGEESGAGEALIERLMEDRPEPVEPAAVADAGQGAAPARPADSLQDESLISSLVAGDTPAQEPAPRDDEPAAPSRGRPSDSNGPADGPERDHRAESASDEGVDQSVIGSLLDGNEDEPAGDPERREGGGR